MSVKENKAVARRATEEAWSQGKLDIVEEVYAADYVMHDLGADYRGPEAIKQQSQQYQHNRIRRCRNTRESQPVGESHRSHGGNYEFAVDKPGQQ